MNGACNSKYCFGPASWGPGEGSKGQISFYFNQRFLYQTLCLFSQMKDTKHIRQDFNSVALVMPQGSDFWALGVLRGYFFQTLSCGMSNRRG